MYLKFLEMSFTLKHVIVSWSVQFLYGYERDCWIIVQFNVFQESFLLWLGTLLCTDVDGEFAAKRITTKFCDLAWFAELRNRWQKIIVWQQKSGFAMVFAVVLFEIIWISVVSLIFHFFRFLVLRFSTQRKLATLCLSLHGHVMKWQFPTIA